MSASPPRDELGRLRDYVPRVADAELAARLRATGAVLIEGPRGCGKTETGLRAARSAVRLDRDPAARRAGILDPDAPAGGRDAAPRRRVAARARRVERRAGRRGRPPRGGPVSFILAGSAVPADDATRHTGLAARHAPPDAPDVARGERALEPPRCSLGDLFAGGGASAARSGHPDPGPCRADRGRGVAGSPVDGTRRTRWSPRRATSTRRAGSTSAGSTARATTRATSSVSCGRSPATPRHEASARTIATDVGGADGAGAVDYHTVIAYVRALTRLFVVEDLPAWSPALRSRGGAPLVPDAPLRRPLARRRPPWEPDRTGSWRTPRPWACCSSPS